MPQKIYIVEGRKFRTNSDYQLALRDKARIDKLDATIDYNDIESLEECLRNLQDGKVTFYTMLEEDYREKITKAIARLNREKEERIEEYAREVLAKKEAKRKWVIWLSTLLAFACLGYFGIYLYDAQKVQNRAKEMENMIADGGMEEVSQGKTNEGEAGQIHLEHQNISRPEILEKYKKLYNSNENLIGWLQIADTKINYPVMQTTDNQYYLKHNADGKEDRNGALFLDKDCDVVDRSTNLIIYGHRMSSGVMFGTLDKYKSESYYRKHPVISFDTIYEEGEYQIVYVFRSKIYNENEVVFKYYQFIDAYSQQEFDSYMSEMEAISLYDTGVKPVYGDKLLTLSTCDYYVKNGRFVVVAKKLK